DERRLLHPDPARRTAEHRPNPVRGGQDRPGLIVATVLEHHPAATATEPPGRRGALHDPWLPGLRLHLHPDRWRADRRHHPDRAVSLPARVRLADPVRTRIRRQRDAVRPRVHPAADQLAHRAEGGGGRGGPTPWTSTGARRWTVTDALRTVLLTTVA